MDWLHQERPAGHAGGSAKQYRVYLVSGAVRQNAAQAKPLKGFGGASVQEIVVDYNRATYRAVYTVRFAEWIYVLHVFQKKAKLGIATPKPDLELIERRLKQAVEMEKNRRK